MEIANSKNQWTLVNSVKFPSFHANNHHRENRIRRKMSKTEIFCSPHSSTCSSRQIAPIQKKSHPKTWDRSIMTTSFGCTYSLDYSRLQFIQYSSWHKSYFINTIHFQSLLIYGQQHILNRFWSILKLQKSLPRRPMPSFRSSINLEPGQSSSSLLEDHHNDSERSRRVANHQTSAMTMHNRQRRTLSGTSRWSPTLSSSSSDAACIHRIPPQKPNRDCTTYVPMYTSRIHKTCQIPCSMVPIPIVPLLRAQQHRYHHTMGQWLPGFGDDFITSIGTICYAR